MKLRNFFPCSQCQTPATHWTPLSETERLYECHCTEHQCASDIPIPEIWKVEEIGDKVPRVTYRQN
jgi:hypothetical protein